MGHNDQIQWQNGVFSGKSTRDNSGFLFFHSTEQLSGWNISFINIIKLNMTYLNEGLQYHDLVVFHGPKTFEI